MTTGVTWARLWIWLVALGLEGSILVSAGGGQGLRHSPLAPRSHGPPTTLSAGRAGHHPHGREAQGGRVGWKRGAQAPPTARQPPGGRRGAPHL